MANPYISPRPVSRTFIHHEDHEDVLPLYGVVQDEDTEPEPATLPWDVASQLLGRTITPCD